MLWEVEILPNGDNMTSRASAFAEEYDLLTHGQLAAEPDR